MKYLQTCTLGIPTSQLDEAINMLNIGLLMNSPELYDSITKKRIKAKVLREIRRFSPEMDNDFFQYFNLKPVCLN